MNDHKVNRFKIFASNWISHEWKLMIGLMGTDDTTRGKLWYTSQELCSPLGTDSMLHGY